MEKFPEGLSSNNNTGPTGPDHDTNWGLLAHSLQYGELTS